MPRVIIEVCGGVASVESSSEEVDVLFFDWDDLSERCGDDHCAVIQHALRGGDPERARRLADDVYYGGEPCPEEEAIPNKPR